jgi:hypothetical protein
VPISGAVSEYPRLHKLPLLFDKIIEHDRRDPRQIAKETNVPIRLPDYATWKKERRMLSVSAEDYIKVQKGPTP